MPKLSRNVIAKMRERGFIPLLEAAKRSGHAPTTLYARIQRGELKGERTGMFHFVEEKSFLGTCPQAKEEVEAAPVHPEAA
jgi:hypothetical protein